MAGLAGFAGPEGRSSQGPGLECEQVGLDTPFVSGLANACCACRPLQPIEDEMNNDVLGRTSGSLDVDSRMHIKNFLLRHWRCIKTQSARAFGEPLYRSLSLSS